MQISASIFKAYDIRGVVPVSLNSELARALGRAFATHAISLGHPTIAVGRDGRLSGPELSQALIEGLVEAGAHVIEVGMVTTPQLYFAAHTVCDTGIQVTGSHNPRDHNGFKMVIGGRAIYGDEIQLLRRIIETESWKLQAGGDSRRLDITAAYQERITSDIRLLRPMKIVIDSGNGVAGATAPALFRALGCEVIELHSEVDGCFPNHHPDPSKPENLRDLQASLQQHQAELGLAFDGDGDRLGIVTRDGETIFPDRQLVLFANDVLQRMPGSPILFDVKCSQRLAPAIESAGGKPMMYKTGHSLIKARMKELDSPLGGEMSGHIFFKERWYGFDDGSYAGCRLLEILSRYPDANPVLKNLPQSQSTPELNVGCAEGEPARVTQQLLSLVKKQGLPAAAHHPKLFDLDGVRIDWDDGFGLIRASNTTAVLVLRFEGHSTEALHRIQHDMLELLHAVKPDATIQESQH